MLIYYVPLKRNILTNQLMYYKVIDVVEGCVLGVSIESEYQTVELNYDIKESSDELLDDYVKLAQGKVLIELRDILISEIFKQRVELTSQYLSIARLFNDLIFKNNILKIHFQEILNEFYKIYENICEKGFNNGHNYPIRKTK